MAKLPESNKTISERIKIIDDKISELKKRINSRSSSLQIKNVNDSIKKLEDQKKKLQEQASSTNTSTTPDTNKTSTKNVGQGTVLKLKKVGEGTVLRRGLSKADTKKTVKKFDSIMRNAKGGKFRFLRKLLPSKDRLSPTQRMAKAGKSKSAIVRKRLGK